MALQVPYSKRAPAGGAYRISMYSGALTGLAATNPLWSLRWTGTASRMVIQAIDIQVGVTTAYGTAQYTAFSLYFARSFTVSDSGGTAITTTQTKDQALDTTMPQSSLFAGNGDLRICTTGTLTAGTRTLDDQGLCSWIFGTTALGLVSGQQRKEFGILDATNPISLRQNEGLVIVNDVAMGATGVVLVNVSMEWTEVGNNYT